MSAKTGIEWTDATWNPVTGCTKVSPGCDHCYAERVTERFHGKGSFATVQLHPDRLDLPLHWRKPRRIFVNSMSDLFHADVLKFEDGNTIPFLARVFARMVATDRHVFQVLTKRPGVMAAVMRSARFKLDVNTELLRMGHPVMRGGMSEPETLWPPHIWMGTSVEDQHWAGIRIPALGKTPAAVRFLSLEPLLGPVDLGAFAVSPDDGTTVNLPFDWVIAGGESGKDARPMRPKWARDIRDQCLAAGVPFLFKQWGEFAPARHGEAWQVGEEFWPIWRYGKKSAGRELDGRTWDEYPVAS